MNRDPKSKRNLRGEATFFREIRECLAHTKQKAQGATEKAHPCDKKEPLKIKKMIDKVKNSLEGVKDKFEEISGKVEQKAERKIGERGEKIMGLT